MLWSFRLNLPYYAYGIILGIGYLAGLWLLNKNFKRHGVKSRGYIGLSLAVCASALVGARIYYIVLFPQHFSRAYDYFAIHEGGLVFYGALIGTALGLLAYCTFNKASFKRLFDFLAPSFALAHAIGRLGCLSNSCCYGTKTAWPKIYRLKSDLEGIYRHPTQLYESFFMLCLAIFLHFNLKKVVKNGNYGTNGGIYLLAYGVFRFLAEFLRGDERGSILGITSLSPAQITSIIVVLASILLLFCANITKNNLPDQK